MIWNTRDVKTPYNDKHYVVRIVEITHMYIDVNLYWRSLTGEYVKQCAYLIHYHFGIYLNNRLIAKADNVKEHEGQRDSLIRIYDYNTDDYEALETAMNVSKEDVTFKITNQGVDKDETILIDKYYSVVGFERMVHSGVEY